MAKIEFGEDLSSNKANSVYLLKSEDDTIVAVLSLENGLDVNKYVSNLQEYLFQISDTSGIVGEGDPNRKVYSSLNYIANGDSRKVAIEKLDGQAKVNADGIATNVIAIAQNASDIQDIIDSIGVDSITAPIGVGICPLNANGKIDTIYLSDSLLIYKGAWDASTNTPTLANADTGVQNFWYRCNVAGSVDFGAGAISFNVGDKVVNNGTIWEKWDTTDEVISVNGYTGAVVLNNTDIGLGNVTNDAQLKRSANDFIFANKATPVGLDIVLIEDSEDSGNKKVVNLSNLVISVNGQKGNVTLDKTDIGLSNVTNDAQLKRSANDFLFTNKATPVGADIILIEDSEDTGNKKTVSLSNLVISVNGQKGNVTLTSSDVGLGNVTNDAQLKRSANDFLFTEKLTPVDNDIVLIEDSEDAGNKKTVKLANLLGGGGGGGGSFAWGLNEDISPLESIQGGIETLDFDFESEMAISALVAVPSSYKAGDQITLEDALFFSAGTSNNVLFKTLTTLIKVGDDITSPTNNHTSTNTEKTLTTANELTAIGSMDLTAIDGTINSVAVAPGDILKVKLYRDNTNETTSSSEDARFIRYSSSVRFKPE